MRFGWKPEKLDRRTLTIPDKRNKDRNCNPSIAPALPDSVAREDVEWFDTVLIRWQAREFNLIKSPQSKSRGINDFRAEPEFKTTG